MAEIALLSDDGVHSILSAIWIAADPRGGNASVLRLKLSACGGKCYNVINKIDVVNTDDIFVCNKLNDRIDRNIDINRLYKYTSQ